MIKELENKNYKEVFEKETKPYLVEIYTVWCPTCKQMAPTVKEVAEEYDADYGFYKANAENVTDLVEEHGIRSVPTFLFMQNGQVKDTHVGFISKEDLIKRLQNTFS